MGYINKLWDNIQLNVEEKDNVITFTVLNSLIELQRGQKDIDPNAIYRMLCIEFTSIFSQQDCHELLYYIQDKITKVTAKHLRKISYDNGLASDTLTASQDSTEEEEKVEITKELMANKKIGMNPFAGMYLSKLICTRCAHSLNRWEV